MAETNEARLASTISEAYVGLSQLADSLDRTYATWNALSTVEVTLSVVAIIFFFVSSVAISPPAFSPAVLVTIGSRLARTVVRFSSTCLVCQATSSEANRAAHLVQRVLARRLLGSRASADRASAALRLLGDYLGARKLAFSARGLFPLDGSTVCALSGTVFTYTIVMMQFDSFEEERTYDGTT
ncbi:uncharacterized protein LOC126365214 [Schistocerca gregaria]|uniref:uncharacterized protein LOC126365214 n=1 Tax=Schistocerca gregaria TaxID=7010 RepID=UPI00211DCA4D|nr:uncharacterized protein LOC126365214 [Schistocerca gregaria]